jgi:uncharacterized surface protein with fasciclin (FAS1) repeats
MNEKYDLVETANHTGNFRIFLQALEAAGLNDTLKETGPYTILAPVDDAFIKMPQTKLHDLFKTENRDSLQALLKNHIIAGNIPSRELKRHDDVRSMNGEELRIESRAGLWVNEAQVVTPDLKASNGILHGIDTVLMPNSSSDRALGASIAVTCGRG